MKSVEKQGMNVKHIVNLRRIGIWIGEITIIMLFVVVTLLVLFVIIAEVVAWFKIGVFFGLSHGWELLRDTEKDAAGALNQDVATIFVAAASILVAVSTIVQAHFTRVQDRVSIIPKNNFSWISISTGLKDLGIIRQYFYKVIGNTCIEFNIKEGFSTCCKANPYRMYIFLFDNNNKRETEWEEIRIYQSKCIKLFDSDVNSCEMLIDCNKSNLLNKYCDLPSGNERYNLKILLDIEWINQLVPKWWRWFANIYTREEIFLKGNFEKNHNKARNNTPLKGLFEKNYQVLYTNHYRASLTPHIKRKEKEF